MPLIHYSRHTLISLFLSTIILCSCGRIVSSAVKDDGNQIPRELGMSKTTMLVLKDVDWKSYNKSLEKNFEQYYKGDYILITNKELKEPKYQDFTIYRYLFNSSSSSMRGFSSTSSSTDYKYYIVDRKENKTYQTFNSSNWNSHMISYIKKLNEVREKNGGK